jgi:TRAP-type C4-dicarboxylate transport system substrate-binding protein
LLWSCSSEANFGYAQKYINFIANFRAFYIYYYIIDTFVKVKADRKREFDDAMIVARAKKARLVEAEKAEKKYLEEIQKRTRHEIKQNDKFL